MNTKRIIYRMINEALGVPEGLLETAEQLYDKIFSKLKGLKKLEGNEDKGMKVPAPITTPVNNTEITTIKRDYSTSARERMAESDQAMPDGSFPIANESDLRNAIQSVGRAKDYNAAKQHIIRRARALGLVDQLPEDWKKNVRKTNWGGSVFDLNPFVK
mgnify:CR=1 FL=1